MIRDATKTTDEKPRAPSYSERRQEEKTPKLRQENVNIRPPRSRKSRGTTINKEASVQRGGPEGTRGRRHVAGTRKIPRQRKGDRTYVKGRQA